MPKRHATRRIYNGPDGAETQSYWTVAVTLAKKPIRINGSLLHALRGQPGKTIGCALSNMAIDEANRSAIGHPVYLAAVTKSTVLLVDRLKKDGSPAHAVQYRHHLGHIADRNDTGTLKKMVTEKPSLIEKPFTLWPARESRPTGTHNEPLPSSGNDSLVKRKPFVPKGALARAVKAGRIGANVAEQLSAIASRRAG